MKYILIGLGNFGLSMAKKLTAAGQEVIAVDSRMNKVELIKEEVAYSVCLDATDEAAMRSLPLREADVVIVTIGEDPGANIMATALLKNQGVKRLVSRAINPLHEQVLKAIGVDEIVHPEEEAADRWTKKLCLSGVVNSFELGEEHSIVEVKVPAAYAGKSLEEIGFRNKHNLLVLTTIRQKQERHLIGGMRAVTDVQGLISPKTTFEAGETMVIYGANKDIQQLLRMDD